MSMVLSPFGSISAEETEPSPEETQSAETSAEPSPTPEEEPSPTPEEPEETPAPEETAPVVPPDSVVEVDPNASTISATTPNPTAGQNFSLIVTVKDTTETHADISGLSDADFELASFDTGTQTATADVIVKRAVIETFPGVYTVTAQLSSPHTGMDIEVTVKGIKLTDKVTNVVVSSEPIDSSCPDNSPIRHYKVTALQGTLPHAVYALEKDASSIENGESEAAPLALRAAHGDCLEIELINRLNTSASMHIGKAVGSNEIQTVSPGERTTYRYFAYREGTLLVRDLSGNGSDQPLHELYGAVIIEPEGSTFLDPRTGRLNPTGLEAVIQGPGSNDDFREMVSVLCEKDADLEVYEEEVVYQTLVNYPIATQKERKASLGLSTNTQTLGSPPLGVFQAYVGDPVRFRVANTNSDRVISFGVEGHTWPLTYGAAAQGAHKTVSDKIVAPMETLDANLDAGAGGVSQVSGNFLWGNSRLPFIKADQWGWFQVLNHPDENLLPLSDRNLSTATMVPSTATPTAQQPFILDILEAMGPTGALLNGPSRVTVTSSVYSEGMNGVIHNADVLFENGSAQVPVTLAQAGEHSLTVQITGIIASQTALVNVLAEDEDVPKAIPSTTTPTQNEPFALEIEHIKGADGAYINGPLHVQITSSIGSEGTEGLVYDADVEFNDGWAQVPLTLAQLGEQSLTVQIAGLTESLAVQVNVQEEQPAEDQSAANLTPSTNEPKQNEPFALNITGAKGTTGEYLEGAIGVRVTSSNSNEGVNGDLFIADVEFMNGTGQIPVILAQLGEQTLTILITGVTASQMAIVNVQAEEPVDQSAATVTPSTAMPTQNEAFALNITNAKGMNGVALTGAIGVQVTSSNSNEGMNGNIFIADVEFTNGSAQIPVILAQLGEQSLTIRITGVTASQTTNVIVQTAPDISTATVIPSTNRPTEDRSFTLQISGAKGTNGADLTGAIRVSVTSSNHREGRDGVLYNTDTSFTNGTAAIRITLEREGNQTLTVQITGVTAAQSVSLNVRDD